MLSNQIKRDNNVPNNEINKNIGIENEKCFSRDMANRVPKTKDVLNATSFIFFVESLFLNCALVY